MIISWLPLFTVLTITLALNICHLCYTPTPQHVSFAPLPSIFSRNLVPRLLSPLIVFSMLAPLFGTPSLLVLDLSTSTPPSNQISKLSCSVLQAFLAPNSTIHALLIHICMLILAPKLFYITLHHPMSTGMSSTH